MDIKFSIIVPVYNVSEFVDACIKSICAQSYNNFELILIDDGSTDGSGEICNLWSENDERIIFISSCNSGPNAARNLGLDRVTGNYLIFVDADDWLDPEALNILVGNLNHFLYDIINFGYDFIDVEMNRIIKTNSIQGRTLTGFEIYREAFHGIILSGVCWNKCYKTSFFMGGNNRFIADKMHARDLFFTKKIALESQSCLIISDVLYHSRFRVNSYSRSFGEKNIKSGIDLAERYKLHFYGKNGGVYNELIDYAIGKHLRYLLVLSSFRSTSFREFKAQYDLIRNSKFWPLTFFNKRAIKYYFLKDYLLIIFLFNPKIAKFTASIFKRLNLFPY